MAPFLHIMLLAMPLMVLAGVRGRVSPGAAVQAAQEKLQKAGEEDAAAHDKAGCFCQTNLAEKQQTVDNMQQQLTSLSHDIDEQNAKVAQLDVEVKQHQQELDSNSNALDTAVSLRNKDQQQFTDEEQLHTQSIDQLQNALAALNPHSTDAALIAIREVTRRTKGSRHLVLLQAQQGLKGKGSDSPAQIGGVMQRMVTTFNRNLQGLREDEAAAKDRHEGLVSAKSSEIRTQKKFILEKSQRLATTKVTVGFQAQIQTRSQKVLDTNVQLLNTLKQICQRNDESFETRKGILQTEYTALAGAQAEIAGAQLLSVSGTSRGDGVEAVCSIPPEFQEKNWREQAKGACDKARSGSKQDAAEAIEALELDIKQAQSEASRKHDDCTDEIHGAQAEASSAASRLSTEADFVGSEQKDAEEQIDALQTQSDNANKAKTDFAQVTQAQKEAFQALRVATSSGENVLKAAANSAGGSKIAEAMGESEKLMTAVDNFVAVNDKDAQQLLSQLDAVQLAAGKAMIPLRLMKADSEEAAIAIKEEGKSRAHASRPKCDAAALASEVSRLSAYRSKLGRAAESLAWESLR